MHAIPRPDELELITSHRFLAPGGGKGGAFHEAEDLQLFLDTPREIYVPGPFVVARLCELDAVATISGPFGIGKNGAKTEAVSLSALTPSWRNVSLIHPVLNKTTRLPQFRDGRVEQDGVDYGFAFKYADNRRIALLLRQGLLVQYAQPRGDHVYFTEIENFPRSGIALMDTVPSTLRDLNRILSVAGKQAIGIYRTEDTFESWMLRVAGRGDIFDEYGDVMDQENYDKRMLEAASSITEAMDLRKELGINFFTAEERPEAGKAVIDILTGHHSKTMQARATAGAHAMLVGLSECGYKAA